MKLRVYVADRLVALGRKTRTGVQRPVGAYRVGVLCVYLARSHVHAIEGREPALLGLLSKKRHLLVQEVTGVTDRTATRPRRGHASSTERLSARVYRREGNTSVRLGRGACRDDRLERDLDERFCEALFLQEVQECWIAIDRLFVEVASDRDVATVGDLEWS